MERDTELDKGVLAGVGSTTIKKLKDAGLVTLIEIAVTPPLEIVSRTGMTIETAKKVTTLALKSLSMYKTADEYHEERLLTVKRITTGSKKLDGILGGGIESGVITELIGEFGASKSQICYTLSVLTQLPEDQGGLDGKVLFIDTENTFSPDRIHQIASTRELDVHKIMSGIHIVRAYNSQHQEQIIRDLPIKLQEGNYKLIILDSAISHYRGEFVGRGTLAERQQNISSFLGNLLRVAESFNLAVVITNQVQGNASGFGAPWKPTGGHVMAHAGTHRVHLRKGREGKRIAKIIDSPYLPENEASFLITEKGIVNIPED